MYSRGGITLQLLLLYLAILPSLLLGYYIYKKDKVEKEPISLLLKTFIGGVISAIIVITVSILFNFGNFNYKTPIETLYYSFIIVSLFEELTKFIIFYFFCYKNSEFNYRYDGLVYASFLALGFATFENILYIFTLQDITTAIYRGVLTVPAHVFFAIFMGYYFGIAKHNRRYHSKQKEKKNLALGFIVPFVLHGFFDYTLLSQSNLSLIFFLLFIFILYIASFKKVKEVSTEGKHI